MLMTHINFWIFSFTQILREINFVDSRIVAKSGASKSVILTHLEALNFDFLWILAFSASLKMHQNHNFRALKIAKMAFLGL